MARNVFAKGVAYWKLCLKEILQLQINNHRKYEPAHFLWKLLQFSFNNCNGFFNWFLVSHQNKTVKV